MAFFGKVGNVLRQTVSKQLSSDLKSACPSLYQAIRCMSSSKLFIGGLSYGTDETSLQEAFSNYGQVVEARVILDRETGRSRGFGFVTYTSSEEASAAIQALDGQDLHGRRVRVNYATDRAPRMSPGYGSQGNSYGGPYGGGGGAGYGGGGGAGYGAGGGAGYGGYDNAGGNVGGGGYQNSGYGSGGGPGNYNQGGFGGYGSQNSSPGSFGAGDGGSVFDSFASGENIGSAGSAGGNVSAGSGFASSGFEEGSGLGHSGGNQFGGYAGSPMNDNAGEPGAPVGEFKDGSESGLPVDKEDDYEPDDYAKRA